MYNVEVDHDHEQDGPTIIVGCDDYDTDLSEHPRMDALATRLDGDSADLQPLQWFIPWTVENEAAVRALALELAGGAGDGEHPLYGRVVAREGGATYYDDGHGTAEIYD